MDFSNNEEAELDEDAVNYNPQRKCDRLTNPISYEMRDENLLQIRRSWEGVGTMNNSNELSDEDNISFINLQRLSMEHKRSPFPDFQFELLDNEADTDGSGCELSLATGTRRKLPARGDSWEDNWLFQKRDPKTRTDFNLASTIYQTADELSDSQTGDFAKNDSDDSECSEDDKWDEIRRVQRPCVKTSSSSSSASGDSESVSSDSPPENNASPENEYDDEIPILEDNHSLNQSPDSGKAKEHTPTDIATDNSEEEECSSAKCDEKIESDSSTAGSYSGGKKQMEDFRRRVFNASEREVTSDDSIKDEVLKHKAEKAAHSRPVNPLLPILLARRTPSPCGTRSCESEGSSSDEFEKKAAAYKQRRRASWCHLEKPQGAKKKTKRRPLQQPRLDEEELEVDVEVAPLVNQEEALVGLERQMLRRDLHHSSFRAKKASPNFVVNPLYQPDGDAAQNQRIDPIIEPIEMHQLCPQRYESGYSSASPDSGTKLNNLNPVPPAERNAGAEGRIDGRAPEEGRIPNASSSGQSHSKSHPSFLW